MEKINGHAHQRDCIPSSTHEKTNNTAHALRREDKGQGFDIELTDLGPEDVGNMDELIEGVMNGVARTSLSTVALWDRPAESAPEPPPVQFMLLPSTSQDAYHPLRQRPLGGWSRNI